MMEQFDVALLVVRLVFGVTLAYHGYNKVFGQGGLAGTAGFFGSIGMRWPNVQARLAAGTEIGAGLLFAAGLLTPFAAAGIIGLMTVATWRCIVATACSSSTRAGSTRFRSPSSCGRSRRRDRATTASTRRSISAGAVGRVP